MIKKLKNTLQGFSKKKVLISTIAVGALVAGLAFAAINPQALQTVSTQMQELFGVSDQTIDRQAYSTTEQGIAHLLDSGMEIQDIAVGDRHSLALTSDGALWAWGDNINGQLGLGDLMERHVPIQIQHSGIPAVWRSVYSGALFSGAIAEDGTLWMWGNNAGTNNNGPLGLGHSGGNVTVPTQVYHPALGIPVYWEQLALGQGNAFGIAEDGTLWSWGAGGQVAGLTANGVVHNANVPREITAQWDPHPDPDWPDVPSQWKYIATNQSHALGIDYADRIWAWGSPADGRLGFGPVNLNTGRPRLLANYPTGTPTLGVGTPHPGVPTAWRSVSAGASHTMAIAVDGTLWAWGNNNQGRLGINANVANMRAPVQVQGPGVPNIWKEANANWLSSSAIAGDDSLWVWGHGGGGRLGFGDDVSNRSFPVLLEGPGVPATWKTTNTGTWTSNAHTLAVAEDGSLWTWGGNNRGRLGKGASSGADTHVASAGDTFRGLYLDGVAAEETEHALANEGSDNWVPWRVAGHPVLSQGSAPWLNGTPLGRSNWTPLHNATVPNRGATGVVIADDTYMHIFFDRLMDDFDFETSSGTIEISQNSASRTATASGFTDAFSGRAMHSYAWNFVTATDRGLVADMAYGQMTSTQTDFDAWYAEYGIEHPAGPFNHPNRGIQSIFSVPLIPYDEMTARIIKVLQMPAGTSVPSEQNRTFQFTAAARQVQLDDNPGNLSMPVANVPTLGPLPAITLSPTSFQSSSGVATMTGTLDLLALIEDLDFSAGEGSYVWLIEEVEGSSNTSPPSHMRYDPARFELRVFVDAEGDIASVEVFATGPAPEFAAQGEVDDIRFTNTYTTERDVPGTDALFRKALRMPEGTTVPAASFEFEFTPVQVSISTDPLVDSRPVAQVPVITPNPTLFIDAASAATTSTVTTATGTLDLRALIAGLNYPDAGIYVWNVREVAGSSSTASPSYMIYSEQLFQVRALVGADGTVMRIDIFELSYAEGVYTLGSKIPYLEFINTYYRNAPLEVTKTIPATGDNALANLSTLFGFTLTLTEHDLASLPTTITAVIYNDIGPVADRLITVTSTGTGATITFSLMHGERLVMPSLPAGTTFNVVEAGHPDFAPSVSVIIGVPPAAHVGSAARGSDLSTGNHMMIDTGRNAADFENNYRDLIVAGLVGGNFPLIGVFLVAIAAVTLLTLRERRKVERVPLIEN